ncbi:MAG: CHAT domain-containing protein [Bacteroidia bacterium]|nr:CHAT domain-containing protein [Bacteroidia bacterium]
MQIAEDLSINIYGSQHPVVAQIYNQLGHISIMEKNGSDAFDYYESGLCANIPSGNCDEYGEYKSLPPYFNYQDMSESLLGKSLCYFSTRDFASALLYLQFCDTLFDRARKGITKLNDKITLGEIISDFTESAVGLCYDMYKRTHEIDYLKQAFYFSEKNKASVLLEALAGQEAQRFAGIPDSVLQKETDLRKYISFYTKKIAEKPDSKDEADFKNLLFNYNCSYDNLINAFEKQYPDYYQLKYNRKTATAEDIQKQLDSGTAMISYFVCDSYLAIFTITNSEFKIKMQYIPSNFTNTIKQYRRAIINRNDNNNTYKEVGYYLYKMLFPQKLNKQITNLIIIPDNILSLVPFETLLTGHAGEKDFNELPYLVRKYNISYSYSATLFNRTFPKTPTKTIEVTQLNDWLAIAPVFSDKNTSGLTLASRNLMTQLDKFNKDTSLNRSYILTTGNYINPLPGTETEVKNIFSVFDSLNYKSKVQLNDVASEQYIKSGDLNNYRIVHFATHGFVNNQKPELSGILLAQIQDTAELQYNIENYISKEQNDGILYSGEIYNMRLNADLVVLSACETGLGKIKKGEGIIGLTRALLYAGAKNIIVSLWQVADESTSQLMIEFYRNFLEQQMQNPTYSLALSKAKLKLIDEGKFSHPFYWSPFILIGK